MNALADRLAAANALLAPYAVPHGGGRGRRAAEEPDDTRFPFQRDCDRIIHSSAFRRLKGKTQVFVADEGDHYRTRLTHTMEVAKIGRDIARSLALNEDLAECIALAHDLGHPPFGHAGEDALDAWMRLNGGAFEHNVQSHRIVTVIERHSDRSEGLNLSIEILEGLLKHSTPYDHPDVPADRGPTLEAQVVNLSDEIAYMAHDVEDALRAKLFPLEDVVRIPLVRAAHERAARNGTPLRGSIVHLLVTDLHAATTTRIGERGMRGLADVETEREPIVRFGTEMRGALDDLRAFLAERMYMHPRVRRPAAAGQEVIEALCVRYHKNPPAKVRELAGRTGGDLIAAIKDYVAGMTDAYARESLRR